jgi:hypothetical protein
MVQETPQREGKNPNPEGQNTPGQPMGDRGRPEIGRDASAPERDHAKESDPTDEEAAEAP